MKYRVNTFDKRIVSIWDLKKDIHIKIYNKDNYHPVIDLYANSIVKYPLEIAFIMTMVCRYQLEQKSLKII